MIPTDRFIAVFAAGAILVGASSLAGVLLPVGIVVMLAALALLGRDAVSLYSSPAPEVTRTCDDKLSVGADNPVSLEIFNPAKGSVSGTLRDEYPVGVGADGNQFPFSIKSGGETTMGYHVTPSRRGDYQLGDIYLRLKGAAGFGVRQVKVPAGKPVKVYPNLLDIRGYELRAKASLAQPGPRIIKLRGRGTEFESLREYLPDDEFRAVDWKATARRNKLMTRQYEQERAQNVIILLDCGRIMGPIVGTLTRLDHSINAAMMLAHVAAVKGDRVGLMAFGEDISVYAAPKSGKDQTLSLLRMTYNLQDASGDSNYQRAMAYLSSRWTRRSLLVVFTDLTDPDSSRPLISALAGMARKHLCMCVSIVDPLVRETASKKPDAASQAYDEAAAREVLDARRLAAASLTAVGAIPLDVGPGDLTPEVVNEYLKIKSAARL